jgi:ABC-type lipoprotein release transport system permease subunit
MSTIWTYYQAATINTFMIAVLLMLAISALASGYKVYKAADMNPVNTLRDE